MNYLIVNLSKVGPVLSEHILLAPNHQEYTGRQTNEAPFLYLADLLAKDGAVFDKIILLVTDECMAEALPVIEEKTTFEYYTEFVKTHYSRLIHSNPTVQMAVLDRYENEDDYYSELFCPISVSENILPEVIKVLNTEGTDQSRRVYVDYSSGSRVTGLVSVLLVRILAAIGADVQKIVYADILSRPARIRDCTDEYDLLTAVENIAKIESGSDRKLEGMNKELKRLGIDIGMDDQTVRRLDDQTNQVKNTVGGTLAKNPIQEEGTPGAGLAQALMQKVDKQNKAHLSKSDYERLMTKHDDDLIQEFHSTIIRIFVETGVITCTNEKAYNPSETISNILRANDTYYYGVKNVPGLLGTVQKWLMELADSSVSPKALFRQKRAVDAADYQNFSVRRPKSVGEAQFNIFDKYLKRERISIQKETQDENFYQFFRYETVFFNYGFPFACMGQGGDTFCYQDISAYYLTKVGDFMQKLENMRFRSKLEYHDYLMTLLDNPDLLEQEIPYFFNYGWKPNEKKVGTGAQAEEFAKTLCRQLEEVRLYRNAKAHHLVNQYADAGARREEADRIREWLREYDRRFAKNER